MPIKWKPHAAYGLLLAFLAASAGEAYFEGTPLAGEEANCIGNDPVRAVDGCSRLIDSESELNKAIDARLGYGRRSIPPGYRGPEVEALQSFLARHGFAPGPIDGVYGATTGRALVAAIRRLGGDTRTILVQSIKDTVLADALVSRGDAYAELGDRELALADLRAAKARLSPGTTTYTDIAQRLAELEEVAVPSIPAPVPQAPEVIPDVPAGGAVIAVAYLQISGRNVPVVTVSGELLRGDDRRFKRALLTVDGPVIVSLSGPGGDLLAGMEIGRTIWTNEYETLVEDEACLSACAYAWLAGRPRSASTKARIGFHAPWKGEPSTPEVSSEGSARLGGYLRDLAMTSPAVVFMTEPGPTEIRWLTFEDAAFLGVAVKSWP